MSAVKTKPSWAEESVPLRAPGSERDEQEQRLALVRGRQRRKDRLRIARRGLVAVLTLAAAIAAVVGMSGERAVSGELLTATSAPSPQLAQDVGAARALARREPRRAKRHDPAKRRAPAGEVPAQVPPAAEPTYEAPEPVPAPEAAPPTPSSPPAAEASTGAAEEEFGFEH